jgi:hypothetical protein
MYRVKSQRFLPFLVYCSFNLPQVHGSAGLACDDGLGASGSLTCSWYDAKPFASRRHCRAAVDGEVSFPGSSVFCPLGASSEEQGDRQSPHQFQQHLL